MIGTKEELLERLNQLSESGLDQVMILPNFDTRYEVIEKVAKDIIPNLQKNLEGKKGVLSNSGSFFNTISANKSADPIAKVQPR